MTDILFSYRFDSFRVICSIRHYKDNLLCASFYVVYGNSNYAYFAGDTYLNKYSAFCRLEDKCKQTILDNLSDFINPPYDTPKVPVSYFAA